MDYKMNENNDIKTMNKNKKEETMNKTLTTRKKITKRLLILGGFILAANFAYSADNTNTEAKSSTTAVTDKAEVKFTIRNNLIINTSTTNLNFGNIAIQAGKVIAPDNAILTIEGNGTTAVSVAVTESFKLEQGSNSIPFTSTLTGEGEIKTEGEILTWTSTNALTKDEPIELQFGGSIVLTGTEVTGNYENKTTINVSYN